MSQYDAYLGRHMTDAEELEFLETRISGNIREANGGLYFYHEGERVSIVVSEVMKFNLLHEAHTKLLRAIELRVRIMKNRHCE